MKVFVTVEIEEEDKNEKIDQVVDMCTAFNKRLRSKKVSTQLKFTDLPRRFEREGYKKASDI